MGEDKIKYLEEKIECLRMDCREIVKEAASKTFVS